jgi:hypothetical protein
MDAAAPKRGQIRRRRTMIGQLTKLAAAATIVAGLALGGQAAGATTVSLPAWEGLDGAGGGGNARVAAVVLQPEPDNEVGAGRIVGGSFVGFQPPE